MAADFDLAVIGRGPFGAAAARHLTRTGEGSVVLIGPHEPTDRRTHQGAYASHYDQGRLTRRISPDRLWAEMTERTFGAVADLEDETGREILHPVGALVVTDPGVRPRHDRSWTGGPVGTSVPHTVHPPGDDSWRHQFPELDFPPGVSVLHEPAPAGMLNPRSLVSAQIEAATRRGLVVIDDLAVGAREDPAGVTITLGSGGTVRAGGMLVAVGSYANHFGLLPDPLPVTVETETYILGTVSHADGRRLTNLPTVHYTLDHPEIADVYLTPPVTYPDGRWKVKMGANTTSDTTLDDLDAIGEWVRRGDTDVARDAMAGTMESILPGVRFENFETGPCIITMTRSEYPLIARVSEHRYVAVAGNGSGAKASDGWGGLAADLITGRPWPEWIDPALLSPTP